MVLRVNGGKPGPLYVFITGSAGTGKSHLIKTIQYKAMRLLLRVCSEFPCSYYHSAFSIGKDSLSV